MNNSNIDNDGFETIFDEELSNNNLNEIPFNNIPSNQINEEEIKKYKLETEKNNDSIMIVDDRVKDIKPTSINVTPEIDNGIIILDDRIKNIKPNKKKNSSFFKHPTIIFPVIAFIFVSILGMYLFVSNSMADSINLIKIEENGKIGYIDSDGTIITRCKYTYGTDYYNGYAIVKNNNNLYGVLNSKGVLEVAFGNYYYIGLFNDRYIVSKITNKGLKQGLLDSNLSPITSFKYDNISYVNEGIYLFVRDETIGIINDQGKEIYKFEVDEIDDRNIEVDISKVTDLDSSEKYAKVKVNNSSTIINVNSGVEVFSYTLKDIFVSDNNVFYIKSDNQDDNNTYIVINNNQIKLKTNEYKRVKVEDVKSNIAIGIKEDTSVDYINLNTKKVINDNTNNDYYYGDGVVLEKTHDFSSNKDIYNIISSSKILGTFSNYIPVDNKFSNGFLKVKIDDNSYNYLNKSGKLLNNNKYETIENFVYSGGIVSNNNFYGLVNSKGKDVIPLSYSGIKNIDESTYRILKNKYKKDIYMYLDENNKIGFINSNNKIEVKAIYDDVEFISNKYPIVLVSYLNEKLLLNIATSKELGIKISDKEIDIKDNYIVVGNNYYNYSGKLIYTVK